MKSLFAWTYRAFLLGVISSAPAAADPASLSFRDTPYLERWSKDQQREFTPKGQEDLNHWADMVTLHRYLEVKDGDTLAAMANAVLENYDKNQAIIVRTDSVPRTPERPAEYFMVALFPRPEFIEAAFTRFRLANGVGTSIVYSHREYGKEIGEQMSAWLGENGAAIEDALMSWDDIPAK